jgi:hypothetical protein
MDEVKCKPKEATGRINNETVLLRIIKWQIYSSFQKIRL